MARPPAAWMSLQTSAAGGAFQVRERGADAEEVPLVGSHLHAGDHEEAIDRLAILPHQALVDHVIHGVAGVVVGDGEAVEAFFAGGLDQFFRLLTPSPEKNEWQWRSML